MYINKIDDLITKVIDDFSVVFTKNKIYSKLIDTADFTKFQKEINKILTDYVDTISKSMIEKIVKKLDSINAIYNTIKKYIMLYVFLKIGYYYKGSDDEYINNIIQFSKEQSTFKFRIDNFFNPESNGMVIENYHIVKNTKLLLKDEKPDITKLESLLHGSDTLKYLQEVGRDNIRKYLMVKSEDTKSHNIIKTLLYFLVYSIQDKKNFFRILEMSESEDKEFMFIDIVRPTSQYLSFDMVESLLKKEDLEAGLAEKIWNFLKKLEREKKNAGISDEEKIRKLINKGFIVPIVDDFLLYSKDNEKYEDNKTPTRPNDKKKDDTKIRYIVNKVELSSELYSDSIRKDAKKLEKVKKFFYPPYRNRKAVLCNEIEDVKIINKYINQGKRSAETNEYFNDLITYRSYPYINFKDFQRPGFSIMADRTVEAARFVSFERDMFRQNPSTRVQMRVFSKGMTMNIVGFIIPSIHSQFKCKKISSIHNIRSTGKGTNAVKLASAYINKNVLRDSGSKASVYWLFEPKYDKVKSETYESAKNAEASAVKNIAVDLYERVKNSIYYEILDEIEKKKDITIQGAEKIFREIQEKTINIDNNRDMYSKFEKYLFEEKLEKIEDTYDYNEDILYGLEGDVHELLDNPIRKQNKVPILDINLSKVDETGIKVEEETVKATCQHYITWEDISKQKRVDHKTYREEIYNFVTKYVQETATNEYICKSCGFKLNISKFLNDGSYDNDTQTFNLHGLPLEIPLEDIPEYSKFRPSIKIMDKIVEKISSILNVGHLVGPSTTIRWRRKEIVKNTIDLIIINNNNLKYKFKERHQRADKMYGINRNISNLWVFPFENAIFQFSSKDKDQYKPLKLNNIFAYILINILLDINESQVSTIATDKKWLCDFEHFDKYYKSLFGDLKVLKNNEGDTVNMVNLKVFSYMLYISSCQLARRRIWHFENDRTKTVSLKLIPIMQKSIIHTIVDTVNSILETSFGKKSSYELDIFRTKYLTKLKSLFGNNEVYESMRVKSRKKEEEESNIDVSEQLIEAHYDGAMKLPTETKWIECQEPKYLFKRIPKYEVYINNLNILTNCDNGELHEWKSKDGAFVCKLCKVRMDTLLNKFPDEKKLPIFYEGNKRTINAFKIKNLEKLSKIYNIDGSLRQLGSKTDTVYSKDKLIIMDKNIRKKQVQQIKKITGHSERIIEKEEKRKEYVNSVILKTKKSMGEHNNGKFEYIRKLIKSMERVIGNDKNILKDSRLIDNVYIIDHNHLGYSLDKNIVITDSDKKMHFKKNHPHFNTDVIYYVNYKGRKIEVFYDSVTNVLLGHKEESKKYVNYEGGDVKIKINYSIYNKLLYLGFTAQHIDIDDSFNHITKKYKVISGTKEGQQKMYKAITKSIMRNRHDNLKKSLIDFYRAVNLITNDHESTHSRKISFEEDEIEEDTYFADHMEQIITKYIKKLHNINVTEDSGRGRIMKHWKAISRGIKINSLDNINFDYPNNVINADTILSYDTSGNILLFYLIEQMGNLLEYNNNKFIKMNIVTFIIDFIKHEYKLFNTTHLYNNKEIKRFMYILKSEGYLRDIAEKDTEHTDSNGNYTDPDEELTEEQLDQQLDAAEERDSLDVEEMDYESGYSFIEDVSDSFRPPLVITS